LNYVSANSTGRNFQKSVLLGCIEKDALTLGQAMRDASAPDALPGRLASTEPFDVVA
jgi:hypothetical protein